MISYAKLSAIVAAIFISGCASTPNRDAGKNDFSVIAYYRGDASEVDKYPVAKLTHIIFSFLHLQGNRLAVDDADDDSTIRHLVSLKEKYPHLKVMLALGGWGGCKTCSEVFSNQQDRSAFAESAKGLLAQYHADGLDLDWEYPAIEGPPGHAYSPEDRQNFTFLIQELRKTFGEQYELSFAAGGFAEFLENSVEWASVMPLVDRVNLMTYDLVNGYSKVTGHHTPLGSSALQKESVRAAVQFLDSLKIPLRKIVIGAAFYARVWENVDDKNNGIYQPGTFKDFVNYKNFETYFAAEAGFQEHFDPAAEAYYRYSPKTKRFATFDHPEAVKSKTIYAMKKGLGGIMFWQLGGDKYENGLLDAIDNAVQTEKKARQPKAPKPALRQQ
ncbi:MAG: glycoside hydrolase family 18 protein [candidate division KSB1 bacterium]|nr:glycoside hydrolase family 18 protein [candidate division KSB1 bacterium]MDZ7303313.1 glycoside hydrolase family 18 protein [candidate division KSB1 bacterium]MDZ7310437.1 glycoside hydrolase family 18 protein [candidate division KSB1 bacterium]